MYITQLTSGSFYVLFWWQFYSCHTLLTSKSAMMWFSVYYSNSQLQLSRSQECYLYFQYMHSQFIFLTLYHFPHALYIVYTGSAHTQHVNLFSLFYFCTISLPQSIVCYMSQNICCCLRMSKIQNTHLVFACIFLVSDK